MLKEIRSEVEIYSTISPENETEEKKAFEDRMREGLEGYYSIRF
ncbi:MAG: hypothetical protein J07AB43_05230 [Candidatus Nanosalina sp. J07AB43]|nr:MAG: hypothetical protein J07AB43_05230 [Candidatus Nanosalina sp. J07AB43]